MQNTPSTESVFSPISAWIPLAAIPGTIILLANLVSGSGGGEAIGFIIFLGIFVFLIPTLIGCFVVGPNQSRALVLFGKYRGTVRKQGFYCTNPFTLKHKVSLKAHNIATQTIKVNDLRGNPIEIGAVVVWQVANTAQALFDVEDYVDYVDVQIETALRAVAALHPYDEQGNQVIVSLRGDSETVAEELQSMIADRLSRAGIQVLEARISHLAYAQEIAQAMLQVQQADALIAAKQKIVEGAVGMVEQALADLSNRKVLEMDDERKATMVSNLLVVLCSQESATPIINAGSLYS